MDYDVVLADSAKADADSIYRKVVEAAPIRGPEWFEELLDSLRSLKNLPYRRPLAREARRAKREIRNLLFGRRHIYRILFAIDEKRNTVWILHIRHGARRDMKPADIARPAETGEKKRSL